MKLSWIATTAISTTALIVALAPAAALADCHFGPFAFFPERNDHVTIKVVTQGGQYCAMAFKQGPGYRFTSASFLTPPPHGVLAKTGDTSFLYVAFPGYHGPDSYAVKICADVRGKHGCSSLTYIVDVQ
jgi:hypothetical protein